MYRERKCHIAGKEGVHKGQDIRTRILYYQGSRHIDKEV